MQKLSITHGAARRPCTLTLVHSASSPRPAPGLAALMRNVLTELLAGEAYRRGARDTCCAG